jgi:hypothetical protein
MPLVDYARTRRPVFDVDLDADPFDRWAEVGKRNKGRLSRFLREIEGSCHDGLESWLPTAPSWTPEWVRSIGRIVRPLASGLGRVGGKLGATIARAFGEDYVAEIRGLAHASGLPESKLFLANLTYDLTVGHEGFFGACSSYSVTVHGAPMLVRNMDWDFPPSTGRYTVMVRLHKGRNSYINIAPLGCVGVLSAMRAGAWAVTLNQAPANGPPQLTQWPAMHRLRKACDTSLTFSTLVRRLTEYQTMTPFFAHVVGTSPAEQVVIESYADSFHRRKASPGKPLVQTNHFVSSFGHNLNPDDGIDENGECWDTYPRYEAISKRLAKRHPQSLAEGLKVMACSTVTHSSTMNQMALCPATADAVVRVRA